MKTWLRHLPAVNELTDHPQMEEARRLHGRELVVRAAQETLSDIRRYLGGANGASPPEEISPSLHQLLSAGPEEQRGADALKAWLIENAGLRLERWCNPRPKRLINATGVLLHTNLGRAPVSAEAAAAMREAAAGYSDLEFDLRRGERGSRHALLSDALCMLSGAEAALVVNNNAGATLLVLSALARDRGVIVSRGQLVEIGGGYRIPDVMAAGGAHLVEVGTTNRTRIADYESALDGESGMLLRVHTSNYKIMGFVESPSLAELVGLGKEHDLPVVDDLGSGSFLDTSRFGLSPEPLVGESIQAGADLVTFSGDKMLGGPQAGLIVGRRELIERLKAHPLTRAMRPGKVSLAGLHATLLHYLRGEAEEKIPFWRMLGASPESLRQRAEHWREALRDAEVEIKSLAGRSAVGGGSMPGESLDTVCVALRVQHPDRLAEALRKTDPPVIGRIENDLLLLDPRTVLPDEDEDLLRALRSALG